MKMWKLGKFTVKREYTLSITDIKKANDFNSAYDVIVSKGKLIRDDSVKCYELGKYQTYTSTVKGILNNEKLLNVAFNESENETLNLYAGTTTILDNTLRDIISHKDKA